MNELLNLLKNKKVHSVLAAVVGALMVQPAAAAVLGGSVPLTANVAVSLVAGTAVYLLNKYVLKG